MKNKSRINPTSLILYLTKRCNSRCPYCIWILRDPNFFHTKVEYDMPLDKAKKIVDYYYDLGVRTVRLQGEGEILLYEHLAELTKYCAKKGYNKKGFDFPTNGILLNKYIDFILDYLSVISISIDGYDAETFIQHRGGNESVFNKIIDGTRELVMQKKKRNAKTVIWINCIMHSLDYKKVFPMIRLAEELGVDKIRFGNYHPIEGGKGLQPVSKDQLVYLKKKISNRKYKVGIKLPRSRKPSYPFICNMLFRTALVGSDYNMSPCCHIDAASLWGDVWSDQGKHNSASLRKFRRKFRSSKKISDLPKPCQSCGRLK